MFVLIKPFLIYQLGQENGNHLVGWFCLVVALRVVGCWVCVFYQKVCGQHFNCCLDEMHTLIADQNERIAKSNEDVFI